MKKLIEMFKDSFVLKMAFAIVSTFYAELGTLQEETNLSFSETEHTIVNIQLHDEIMEADPATFGNQTKVIP